MRHCPPMVYQLLVCLLLPFGIAWAEPPIDVWPKLAPGESTRLLGEEQPPNPKDKGRVTRVVKITRPTFTVHVPPKPNGTAAVILPGGGFLKVVPDKEGTEAAEWLSQHGVTSFVLSYRTTPPTTEVASWKKALQDAQRTLSIVRARASEWNLKPDRIGLVAFSAGGQVGARLLCDGGQRAYEPLDSTDSVPYRPDFAVLVYPWKIYDEEQNALIEGMAVPDDCPPTFLIHTHNDRSSSLGAVLFYAGLKRHGIPAALHVYGNGGHGYGLRPVKDSQISSWPNHAGHWLATQGFARHAP